VPVNRKEKKRGGSREDSSPSETARVRLGRRRKEIAISLPERGRFQFYGWEKRERP